MKTIWKLFVGDIRRITSNVVSIIIVIGLVVIPGIFTWFNVAASWDPFANTGNLKFAVANEDDGYRSDLIPVKINIGDQVVNTLRSNDQLDWTFTTKKEAINGTKSGEYYAAVVIPKNFSTRMMTFFASDGDHAEIAYYNNEKKNALAPKITGQGARYGQRAGQRDVLRNTDQHRAECGIATRQPTRQASRAGTTHAVQRQYQRLRGNAHRRFRNAPHVQHADTKRTASA